MTLRRAFGIAAIAGALSALAVLARPRPAGKR